MGDVQYTSVLITHDNRWVMAGTELGYIFIWDIKTGELVDRIQHHRHKNVVFRLNISPNGNLIASSDTTNIITIWNRDTKQVVTSISHDAELAMEVLFADDETVYAGLLDERFVIWSCVSGRQIYTFTSNQDSKNGGLRTLHLSPDGETLALGYEWGNLEVWNIKTSRLLYTHMYKTYYMNQVRFSHDGLYLLITADLHLSICESQTGKLLKELTNLIYDHAVFSNDLVCHNG